MGTDRPEPHKNLYVRMIKLRDEPFVMPDMSLIKVNKIKPR